MHFHYNPIWFLTFKEEFLKLAINKKAWIIVAVALVVLISLGIMMFRKQGPAESTRRFEPPIEKDRASAVMVRDMDLRQRSKESGKPVWTEGTAESLSTFNAVPKIVRASELAVKMAPAKTPTAQPTPVKITRYKAY